MDFITFDFEGKSVRWVVNNGVEQAVAHDVCKVLGIDDASQALSRLKQHQKSSIEVIVVSPLNKAEFPRKLLTINEKGLYKLILTSRKPEAERFQDWIIDEVLPSIRRTGQYRLTPERVLENAKYPVQIQHTKDVATFLYPQGKQVIIRWMVDSFVGVKGMYPKTYVKNAYLQGDITNKNLSGREALRRREPPKACVISLMDQLRFEFQTDDMTAIEVAKQFEPGFNAFLNAGLMPAELSPSPLEQQSKQKQSMADTQPLRLPKGQHRL
jgi:prophage antirepressor-like protein